MAGGYILILLIGGIGMLVQARLKSKFKKYSHLHLQNNLTGREIAEKMLTDNHISDVKVISAKGMLTDHYNPQNKTVNLSEGVYNQRNAAAAAVARGTTKTAWGKSIFLTLPISSSCLISDSLER